MIRPRIRHVDPQFLGRVSGADYFGSFVFNPVAPPMVGLALASWGPTPTAACLAAVAMSVALLGVILTAAPATRRSWQLLDRDVRNAS